MYLGNGCGDDIVVLGVCQSHPKHGGVGNLLLLSVDVHLLGLQVLPASFSCFSSLLLFCICLNFFYSSCSMFSEVLYSKSLRQTFDFNIVGKLGTAQAHFIF